MRLGEVKEYSCIALDIYRAAECLDDGVIEILTPIGPQKQMYKKGDYLVEPAYHVNEPQKIISAENFHKYYQAIKEAQIITNFSEDNDTNNYLIEETETPHQTKTITSYILYI